jgi:hypothetical protein
MWAILGTDNKTVIGVLPPDIVQEVYEEYEKKHVLILVTPETGLGYIPGYYKDGKFYKGEDEE